MKNAYFSSLKNAAKKIKNLVQTIHQIFQKNYLFVTRSQTCFNGIGTPIEFLYHYPPEWGFEPWT